jgi:hypothetical protein
LATRRGHIFTSGAAIVAICCGGVVAGCGGGDKKKETTPQVSQPPITKKSAARNPARGKNRWKPVVPGHQSVREGKVIVGHRTVTHRRVYTVTGVHKKIDGIDSVAILDQDFNAGQLSEQAIDWQAEDKQGNVLYLGSYTETYEGGQFLNATDGWLAGIKGSKGGVIMKAKPKVGDVYYESRPTGYSSPASKVIKTGVRKCVPFKCYKDVVVIQEGGENDPEWKYYAPGAGGILTEPHYSGGEQETELLVNVTTLSKRSLDELNAEVLKLDKHARQVFPDVYGKSKPAKRGAA